MDEVDLEHVARDIYFHCGLTPSIILYTGHIDHILKVQIQQTTRVTLLAMIPISLVRLENVLGR